MPRSDPVDAIVVGSGPNGLAAAVTLARAQLSVLVLEVADEIGGGTRSHLSQSWGTLHDDCSAVHPFGAVSPFLQSLDLGRRGLEWLHGQIAVAHPLDGGRVATIERSIDATVAMMGIDGSAWRRAFEWSADHFSTLAPDVFGPLLGVPRHPLALARFGFDALRPAARFAKRFETDETRALYAGVAAHAFRPLDGSADGLVCGAVGALMISAGHRGGWPVARGGSQAIAAALASELNALGGTIETGRRVESLRDLPPSRIVMLDVAPRSALDIVGSEVPSRVATAFRRWRHGPGSHKVDLVVEGGIPWADDASARAVTVHCGGTFEQVAEAEREVHRGRMPRRPFVLVAQQYLADPDRSNGAHHPVWAYAHVPHGYSGDATEALLDQIERFAPGFRDTVVSIETRSPAQLQAHNPNYVGGDIATGANSPGQLVFHPRPALDPYRITSKAFLCSAATPPGAGVHGMCGWHAARSALATLDRG